MQTYNKTSPKIIRVIFKSKEGEREREYLDVVSSYQDHIQYDPLGTPYFPEMWQTGSSQSYFEEIQWRDPTQNVQKGHLRHLPSYATWILHMKMEPK